MPIYIYKCDKCKRIMEVRHSSKDIMIKHSDITEGHAGLAEPCNGNIKRIH